MVPEACRQETSQETSFYMLGTKLWNTGGGVQAMCSKNHATTETTESQTRAGWRLEEAPTPPHPGTRRRWAGAAGRGPEAAGQAPRCKGPGPGAAAGRRRRPGGRQQVSRCRRRCRRCGGCRRARLVPGRIRPSAQRLFIPPPCDRGSVVAPAHFFHSPQLKVRVLILLGRPRGEFGIQVLLRGSFPFCPFPLATPCSGFQGSFSSQLTWREAKLLNIDRSAVAW